jgi:hypothetical protein
MIETQFQTILSLYHPGDVPELAYLAMILMVLGPLILIVGLPALIIYLWLGNSKETNEEDKSNKP